MILDQFPEVRRLSSSDKLTFVKELWNELATDDTPDEVDPRIVDELEHRMEEFRQRPNEFTTWEAIKAKLVSTEK